MCVKVFMKQCSRLFVSIVVSLLCGCSSDDDLGDFQIFAYNYDFNQSDFGWQAGFSDFPASSDSGFYELQFAYAEQVSESLRKKALMISGNNHSDDLFMYVKKKVEGLVPDTDYTVTFEIEFASDAEQGEFGAGGSPGESVFLKVGATEIEPKSLIENDQYVMNIDKGNQAEDGEDMVVIGNIAVPQNTDGYALALRSNSASSPNSTPNKPFVVRANSQGQVWLIVGTDSGFEGLTTLYYTKVSAVFSK